MRRARRGSRPCRGSTGRASRPRCPARSAMPRGRERRRRPSVASDLLGGVEHALDPGAAARLLGLAPEGGRTRCRSISEPELIFRFIVTMPRRGRHAQLREQVAAASRRLAHEGLVLGTSGNVSARDGDRVAISPTGAVLGELEADAGHDRRSRGRPCSTATWLRPPSSTCTWASTTRYDGAGAVVHTHAPIATALSCVRRRAAAACTTGCSRSAAPCASRRTATFGTPGARRRACSTRSRARPSR